MADRLDMEYINSLPQPLFANKSYRGDWWWPVHDICVETGLLRIDVMGMLDVLHISDVAVFRDMDEKLHDPDDFYLDSDRAATRLAEGEGK